MRGHRRKEGPHPVARPADHRRRRSRPTPPAAARDETGTIRCRSALAVGDELSPLAGVDMTKSKPQRLAATQDLPSNMACTIVVSRRVRSAASTASTSSGQSTRGNAPAGARTSGTPPRPRRPGCLLDRPRGARGCAPRRFTSGDQVGEQPRDARERAAAMSCGVAKPLSPSSSRTTRSPQLWCPLLPQETEHVRAATCPGSLATTR